MAHEFDNEPNSFNTPVKNLNNNFDIKHNIVNSDHNMPIKSFDKKHSNVSNLDHSNI